MNYRIELTDIADMEVQNIVLRQIGHQPDFVEQWQEKFERTVNTLTQFPGRCPFAPENKRLTPEVRQLLFGPYRILFTLVDADGDGDNDTVSILHVRHGAQQWLGDED